MKMKESTVNQIVSLAAMALIALPVGIACIILGYGLGDTPCILCWQERTAMVLVALIAIFITRYGLKPKYLGALIFASVYGLWAGYRHSSNHILKDIGQGFGPAILGVHTYVWVMVVFLVILLFAAVLLMLQGDKLSEKEDKNSWTMLNKSTVMVFLVVIGFNIVQAFSQTGPFPFIGQSDPYRMTFDNDKIVWSTANWPKLSSLSARGSFAIERPDFANMAVVEGSEIVTDLSLTSVRTQALPAEIIGLATGISYSPNSDIYAVVTSDNWVHFLKGDLSEVLASVMIDGAFSVEISNLTGVVFDGDNSVVVTADHKSYVRLEYDPLAKIADSYWKFMDGTDGVKELKRSRFSTVRAKYNYIGGLGWDAATQEYVTITLPAKVRNNFVVSRFSNQDFELNSEAKILNAADTYPMVTGLAIEQNKAYLLSQSAEQILVMSTSTNNIEAAYGFSGVANAQGLTLVKGEFAVLNGVKGQNSVTFFH
ncbi:disulfide bond formation protein B [Shewanella hanedai]|uniref:Disulfide bond formation protein B n=1 Tax=Shewanella hanedai TaxID=25 RepID=A0A553JQK2_SHEHA|nr:disulfide bond formation protein B [Shewanella hanedai]TRY14746.1 disulfide bond formation protein B [Shewanella hanedai]GGI76484.1 disulfide bond formation protein B [Shewanella hanedai]